MHTRPRFLTTLCVLSYLAGVWLISGAFTALTNPPAFQEGIEKWSETMVSTINSIEEVSKKDSEESIAYSTEYFNDILDHAFVLNLSTLFLSLISIVGVFLMFRQRKIGFHFYTAANVFAPLVPIFVLGVSEMTLLAAFIGMFFSVAFIMMYAYNLKSMN